MQKANLAQCAVAVLSVCLLDDKGCSSHFSTCASALLEGRNFTDVRHQQQLPAHSRGSKATTPAKCQHQAQLELAWQLLSRQLQTFYCTVKLKGLATMAGV